MKNNYEHELYYAFKEFLERKEIIQLFGIEDWDNSSEAIKDEIIEERKTHDRELEPARQVLDKLKCGKPFYRYRKIDENTLDALENNKLYFNSPNRFNDPFDSLPYYDISELREYKEGFTEDKKIHTAELEQKIKQLKKEAPVNSYLLLALTSKLYSIRRYNELVSVMQEMTEFNDSDYIESINEAYRKRLTVACFSSDKKNMLMWSHYADSHRGFTITYDFSEVGLLTQLKYKQKENNYSLLSLFPVIYHDKSFDFTKRLIGEMKKLAEEKLSGQKVTLVNDLLSSIKLCCYKSKYWEYEKEWRLLYQDGVDDDAPKYIEMKPKEIYLGCQIKSYHQRIITDIAKNILKIPIYKMELMPVSSEYSYTLEPTQL